MKHRVDDSLRSEKRSSYGHRLLRKVKRTKNNNKRNALLKRKQDASIFSVASCVCVCVCVFFFFYNKTACLLQDTRTSTAKMNTIVYSHGVRAGVKVVSD